MTYNYQLDQEEQDLLQAYEESALLSDLTPERKVTLEKMAAESTKKDRRMNIRISSRDMKALQRRALREGLPYQTLVTSILHKYLSGGLVDITTEK